MRGLRSLRGRRPPSQKLLLTKVTAAAWDGGRYCEVFGVFSKNLQYPRGRYLYSSKTIKSLDADHDEGLHLHHDQLVAVVPLTSDFSPLALPPVLSNMLTPARHGPEAGVSRDFRAV